MREPSPTHSVYGLLAEFNTVEALVEAAKKAKAAGYTRVEGFSPFPIDALAEVLGVSDNRVPMACLIGAFTILLSTWWRIKGKTTWKGRTYP